MSGYLDWWQSGLHREFDSPIEQIFFDAWEGEFLCLHPQVKIMKSPTEVLYRLDFSVEMSSLDIEYDMYHLAAMDIPRIAVELDGHEFHERTKDQVKYRDRRDRFLQQNGWVVMHFSGSAVNRDPKGCAREVETYANRRFLKALGEFSSHMAREVSGLRR